MTRPRVAVGSCLLHADPQRAIFKGKELQYTEEKMARALWRAGAVPVPVLSIPEAPEEYVEAMLAHADGLLLQGGSDVAPQSYGQKPLRPEWSGDAKRDAFEILLVAEARRRRIPILGICRGVQILNVALGGSLFQDIGTQVEGALNHREWAKYEVLEHNVQLDVGSWVHGVYGAAEILTNTVHHQSIDRVADPLTVTARAPDGVIEAVEATDDPTWMVGIQWHPEWLDGSEVGGPHRSRGDAIFEAFSEVCREQRSV